MSLKQGFGGIVDFTKDDTGFCIRKRFYVGGLCVEDASTHVVSLVDGITNLSKTTADDNVLDSMARIGLNIVPEKQYVFGHVDKSQVKEGAVVQSEDPLPDDKAPEPPAQ